MCGRHSSHPHSPPHGWARGSVPCIATVLWRRISLAQPCPWLSPGTPVLVVLGRLPHTGISRYLRTMQAFVPISVVATDGVNTELNGSGTGDTQPVPHPRSARSSPSPGRQSSPAKEQSSRGTTALGSPSRRTGARPQTPPPGAKVGQALGALLALSGAQGGASTTIPWSLQQTALASPPARRFERELYAPLPNDFIFPFFKHFSFYDQSWVFSRGLAVSCMLGC